MQQKESKTTWHFSISLMKSLFRLVGFTCLIFKDFVGAGLILVAAEVLGILEEF